MSPEGILELTQTAMEIVDRFSTIADLVAWLKRGRRKTTSPDFSGWTP
jgi:site-specific recombinase